jgi:hypothetical protein
MQGDPALQRNFRDMNETVAELKTHVAKLRADRGEEIPDWVRK